MNTDFEMVAKTLYGFEELLENELKQKRLELEATSREIRMAESYHSSKTFKMDGRSWYDLPEDLRSSFRQQFISYYNQR